MMRLLPKISGKALSVLALVAMSCPGVWARHLQPQEALMMLSSGAHRVASTAPLNLAYTQKNLDTGESTVYVFNRENAPGFYLLAADDAVGDIVLGYSQSAYFSPSSIPTGFSWLLSQYSGYVSRAASGMGTPVLHSPADASRQPISPIVATQWNQNAPYNNMCPVLLGNTTVTGCIATAVAQIMKVHEWPVQGTGSNSYNISYNGGSINLNISSDFSSHVYDWPNMLNSYEGSSTAQQQDAVAQLMYDCGVASNMVYNTLESSATSVAAGQGLLKYFDYDASLSYDMRDWYSSREWSSLLYDQISQGLPVLYSGNGPEGGHAFVLDGYDGSGYFHFNWGWGGLADGYYSLSDLSPSSTGIGGGLGSYNEGQTILANIKANAGSLQLGKMALIHALATDKTQYASRNAQITFSGDFCSYALEEVSYALGVKLSGTVDDVITLYNSTLKTLNYYPTLPVWSHYFPEGEYDLTFVYKSTNDTEWHEFYYNKSLTSGRLHFVNDGSTITVSQVPIPEAEVEASEVTLNATEVELTEGDTYQLVATVAPDNTTDKTVTWTSSDSQVATVSPEGIVTAVAPGKAVITASCGEVCASCTVIVKPKTVEATGITLNATEAELTVGDTYQLIATVSPDNTTDKTVTWTTSDASVATVSADGVVTAVAAGNAVITATCGSVSASCSVTVKNPIIEATGITLNATEAELTVGDVFELVATIIPDNTTDQTVTWTSSDPSIASVDANGRITALAAGTAIITATCGNVSATCTVTVKIPIIEATGITLNASEVELTVGDTYQLTATVNPDNTTDKTVTWTTSDASVATVSADGVVTAMAAGNAVITATCGSVSATCTIVVKEPVIEASGITLNATEAELTVGDVFELVATIIPDNTTDQTVTWTSSDPSIASVDANGRVTALAAGTAVITATCGSVSATCTVTVKNPIIEATGITLNATEAELTVGDTYQLTATISPDNTTDKTVVWTTSDASVATVSADGVVTAVAAGTAVITATCGSVSATCTIVVKEPVIEASGITLSATEAELTVGDVFELVATIIPDNTTDQTVTWASSDPSIASVDADGRVTALAAGTAIITATCGNVSATCTVVVKDPIIEASAIALNISEAELNVGDILQLIATVSPDNTTDPAVAWSSSDADVAAVDGDGRVSAIAPGTAVITATCGSVSAECKVTVKEINSLAIIETDGISIIDAGGSLRINAPKDAVVALYDISGKLLYCGLEHIIPVEREKVCIVVVADKSFKIRTR